MCLMNCLLWLWSSFHYSWPRLRELGKLESLGLMDLMIWEPLVVNLIAIDANLLLSQLVVRLELMGWCWPNHLMYFKYRSRLDGLVPHNFQYMVCRQGWWSQFLCLAKSSFPFFISSLSFTFLLFSFLANYQIKPPLPFYSQ